MSRQNLASLKTNKKSLGWEGTPLAIDAVRPGYDKKRRRPLNRNPDLVKTGPCGPGIYPRLEAYEIIRTYKLGRLIRARAFDGH